MMMMMMMMKRDRNDSTVCPVHS